MVSELELSKHCYGPCTQALFYSLALECEDISCPPRQVWHPISLCVCEISGCIFECHLYSLLFLDSSANCSPEQLVALWSGKLDSYIV